MVDETVPRYDASTIRLHWAIAIIVPILWTIGQTADWIPDGPANTAVWSIHVVLGFVLLVLLIWLIVWRTGNGRRLPAANGAALHLLAKATHSLLYLMLAIVVALGIGNAFVRGYNLFDLISLPQIGDRALRKPITAWHGLAANVLLAIALFHAAAALIHHYLLHDNVFRRMLPSRS